MRGVRRTGVCLVATIVVGLLGVNPAVAKTRIPNESPHVYLSAPLGGAAEGAEGTAPWEAGPITLSSTDLRFATSAGATECALEVPVGVSGNTGRFGPSLIGETPGSMPCSGTVGSEPAELKTEVWSMTFSPKGTVSACIDPAPYGAFPCPTSFNESLVTLAIGSLECTYLHSAGKKRAAMTGSFDPAALHSAEPNTVAITLPAQKFKLTREQRKSPAFSGCPKEGQLSGHFSAQTEQDGPVQARVVDGQQVLANPPVPCGSLGLNGRCTVTFINDNRTEAVKVHEIFVTQGGVRKEEEFVRVPTAGECAGSAESGQPTVLSPGQSCSVVVERATEASPSGDLIITTASQPGGAPGFESAFLP